MVTDLTRRLYEDVTRYDYGNVAARLVVQKDLSNARGALKKQTELLGSEDEYGPFIDFALNSKYANDGIPTVASLYAKKFNDAIERISLGDLYELRYDSILHEYLSEEDKEEVKTVISEHAGESYTEIMKKIMQAEEKVESRTDNFSAAQKREAKQFLKQYQNIKEALDLLERAKFEELRPAAARKELKSEFKNYVKSLSEED